MLKYYLIVLSLCSFFLTSAQEASISGVVTNSDGAPLSFVSVTLFEEESESAIKGISTNEDGSFRIDEIVPKEYNITFSYIGFETKTETLLISSEVNMGTIVLEESTETLDETIVTSRRPAIKKEAGKLIFTVENTSLSSGNTLNLLAKTPGVLIIQGEISVKSKTPVIYINNRRVYLSASEVRSLLTNTDASNIKAIEVITNPSSKYDAEGNTVLNIITSKPISIGYKGAVNATYEQAVYPKFAFGTSHFYKNNWLSLFGSYTASPRKEYKDQEDFIRFFEPDGSVNSIWETDFHRTSTSLGHQGNIIADFNMGSNNTLSFASNIFVVPNTEYHNDMFVEISNSQQQLDSTFRTNSFLKNDKSNLAFTLAHTIKAEGKGAEIESSLNYIRYRDDQFQQVETTYFLPSGALLLNRNFFTDAIQESDIITGQMGISTPFVSGDFEAGVKYSNIETKSNLNFFNGTETSSQFNEMLSDEFLYDESIYAAYLVYSRKWALWTLEMGLRSEYTEVAGNSQALGEVNNQEYLEFFPSFSLQHNYEDHTIGLSYARRITRPRYQSLNPFKYFLNENNFNAGNPNLVPAIDNKITLSYSYKDAFFVDLYYHQTDDVLSILTFQDNENRVLRNIDANLIRDFQYSIDLVYAGQPIEWWYLSLYTSGFYFENEFFSEESAQEIYTNSILGFYGQLYSGLTFSKKQSLSCDVTAAYLSRFIYGSYVYDNQFNLSISFRKAFWNDRASITVGVDDIFNTYNVPVTSKYYNQDNSYFAMPETRLFRLGLKYAFGNSVLRDNKRAIKTTEEDRLEKN